MKTALYFRSISLLLVILCGVGSATAQTKAKQNGDAQDLIALIKQAVDAQANFDAAVLEKLYASDYLEVSPVGEVDPREEAIGFYKAQTSIGGNQTKAVVAADEFSSRFYGNVAVVVSRLTFSQEGTTTPQRPPISFRATYVCRKENGRWKISSLQVTGIRPPRPQQPK